ncbi:MAG: hypothetical protein WDZ59_01330 [Pirellulales bacterium]
MADLFHENSAAVASPLTRFITTRWFDLVARIAKLLFLAGGLFALSLLFANSILAFPIFFLCSIPAIGVGFALAVFRWQHTRWLWWCFLGPPILLLAEMLAIWLLVANESELFLTNWFYVVWMTFHAMLGIVAMIPPMAGWMFCLGRGWRNYIPPRRIHDA